MSTAPALAYRLLTVAGHREVEQAFAAQHPQVSLMRRAAEAAFQKAQEFCGDGGRVLLLAGPGNNGGDAWVLAELLHKAWFKVTVVARHAPKAPEAMDAAANLKMAGILPVAEWPAGKFDLIVDGLFGIGLTRPPDEWSAGLIHAANAARDRGAPLLALDIPSGLEADSGLAHEPCIRATHTISFIAGKPGLHTADGPDYAGSIQVAGLGTHEVAAAQPAPASGELIAAGHALLHWPHRRANSHKGSYGSVGVIAGAAGMAGAGFIAARAALRSGAGKVFLGLLEEGIIWDPLRPEIMVRRARDLARMEGLSVLVVGPGLGLVDPARALLNDSLKANIPMVLDADALNLIAHGKALQTLLRRRTEPTVLTPHPAEAARLLGVSTGEIMQDRIASATRLAREFNCTVVLKGAGSILARPDGQWAINASGNPGMASGGMGDALAGLLGALLAQGLKPWAATCLGTWVHGAAADDCVQAGNGPAGLLASDVIERLPASLAALPA